MDSQQNSSATPGINGGQTAMTSPPSSSETSSPSSSLEEGKQQQQQQEQQQKKVKDVISSVDRTLGLLHQLYHTVSSFNVDSQLPLLLRLNAVVAELDTLQKLADGCDIQVPMEVINLIDDGKNPDEFTKDVFSSFISRNQVTKGKTDAFKSLRKHLLEELEQAFPEEVETYREIRATSAAESKRLAQAQSILPNGDMKDKMEH